MDVYALELDSFQYQAECFHRNHWPDRVLQFKEKRKQVRNGSLRYFPRYFFIGKQQNPNVKLLILQQFSPSPQRAPRACREQNVADLDHVELGDAIFFHAHRKRNTIFLYEHFGYTKLSSAQKHNPKAFSKGSLNNGKEMHRGSLKETERRGEETEKWLFSILMAEHPI